MSATSIDRFRNGIERCLCKAATASSREMETLWLSAAGNYRFLLNLEQREQERGTWEWNMAATIEQNDR